MWFRLFRAELHKIVGNRWVTGCMIWVFPALAVLVTILALLAAAFSPSFRDGLRAEPALWTEVAILPWLIPNNPLGRGLLLGFTAVLFAGEYQWNTWKAIVPRSQRVPLILVKFLAVALFVVFAFALMSTLLTLGIGLVSFAGGASFGPSLDSDTLTEFARDYGLQMLYAFMSTIIAAGYASLAAMITRSILGSAITGILVSIGETMLFLPLYVIAELLGEEGILHLYRFVPSFNLLNLFSWLNGETPGGLEMPSGRVIVDSQLFAEVVLACWVIGLVVLTAYAFQRQDITN
jgi:ABC-2 type transport system permease protein